MRRPSPACRASSDGRAQAGHVRGQAGQGHPGRAAGAATGRPGPPAQPGAADAGAQPGADHRHRHRHGDGSAATRIAPLWLQLTTWILSLVGLGVSVYLTITHYDTAVTLACSDKGVVNCGLVTSSPESMVFGVFPVAVLGLAFYVFMAVATSPWAWRSRYPQVAIVRLASVIVGIGFVLYLVYTELFTLNHICLWCTSVHVVTFLLFVLILISAAVGYGFRNPDRA